MGGISFWVMSTCARCFPVHAANSGIRHIVGETVQAFGTFRGETRSCLAAIAYGVIGDLVFLEERFLDLLNFAVIGIGAEPGNHLVGAGDVALVA